MVKVGKGRTVAGPTQKAGGLPIVTNAGDQTKNQVFLHVEGPTKPYQDLCSRCETDWWIWIGLPTLTTVPIWVGHHYNIVLPTLTSRGVKYTHNDHKHSILDPDRGPTRIRLIPQEHPQKKVVEDGGAKHRSMDTPTEPHNVATRHAVAKVHTVAESVVLTPHSARFGRTV